MNEQVKTLMVKHGLHKYITDDCQHRMEFLADVIIKECIRLCDEVDIVGADDCIAKIKDHFEIS